MTTTTPAADPAVIDQALADLRRGESAWAQLGLAGRRELLEGVHRAAGEHAAEWVRAAATYKQLPEDSPLLGEEWTSGPYPVLTGVAMLIETIRALEAGRSPVDGFPIGTAPGGRVKVRVMPHSVYDRLLLSGFSAEVWMQPGIDAATVRASAGLALRDPAKTGGIGAVMGAGNITSIPVLDVLYELYAHNRVVVLKLNPITDVLFEVFGKVLEPLISRDFVRIVTGGADVGTQLVRHPDVAHVHMTGSALTHDAIVFGTGPEGAARKAAGDPLLDKPITSELGGVSPTIVVPGRWSEADLAFQAEHVVTQKMHNGGYNCIASQVVIVNRDWAQKDRFLAHLRSTLAKAPKRPAYYPGSSSRVEQAASAYQGSETLGGCTLVRLDSEEPGPAVTTEYFGPVLAVLEVPGDRREFLTAAVDTANEKLAGTLGANIIADPRSIAELGDAFEAAIAALRYGSIAVNAWTGLGYMTAAGTWGAFPGHTIEDVQSGIGVVHNAVLLDRPERTIVRGPFRPSPRSIMHGEVALTPRPPWFVTNRTAATTGRRLVGFAARPRWSALPGIFSSALRG